MDSTAFLVCPVTSNDMAEDVILPVFLAEYKKEIFLYLAVHFRFLNFLTNIFQNYFTDRLNISISIKSHHFI